MDQPKTYLEFCVTLEHCLAKNEFSSENDRTDRFSEAMHAWLMDTKGGGGFFDGKNEKCISWNDLIKLLKASAIYE